jgi:hypothetical protein
VQKSYYPYDWSTFALAVFDWFIATELPPKEAGIWQLLEIKPNL